jgi:hypothetical protein
MTKLFNIGLSLAVAFSFNLAHAIQNGDYRCSAETRGLSIPDYARPPSRINLNFTIADLLDGGFKVTSNDFDFPAILEEEIVKGERWMPGKMTYDEKHKRKNNSKTYEMEESQSYQSYVGFSVFKWSKKLNLYEDNKVVKLDIEYATYFGENLSENDRFKLEYTCDL